jgi:hypothetical protein
MLLMSSKHASTYLLIQFTYWPTVFLAWSAIRDSTVPCMGHGTDAFTCRMQHTQQTLRVRHRVRKHGMSKVLEVSGYMLASVRLIAFMRGWSGV